MGFNLFKLFHRNLLFIDVKSKTNLFLEMQIYVWWGTDLCNT